MPRKTIAVGRLAVLLSVVALSSLAFVSQAVGADPTASPAASADAAATPVPNLSPVPGTLGVTLLGTVDDSSYPTVTASISIADAVTGRPVTGLDPSNVAPDPIAKIVSVTATTATLPAAYVLDIDTSGSMGEPASAPPLAKAKSLAKSFAAGVGPDDLVKLVTFDETTVVKTGWLKGNDPTLAAAIDAVKSQARKTFVSDGLVQAAKIADGRPSGYDRRAVVVITDASPADKDANLSSATMRQKLGAPTFVVGLLTPSQVGAELTQLLSDVATYTGGSYQSAGATPDGPTLFAPAYASTQSAWKVAFATDYAPDGNSHQEVLTITDARQRSGTATVTYRSGNLPIISPLSVAGLKAGDVVTADSTVTISVGGSKTWKDARIDLFVDCDPSKCSPTFTSSNNPLTWRLSVASLTQGSHRIVMRLTTTDDQGLHYSSDQDLSFTRSGTTWNLAAVILIGGIGLLAIAAAFIASRRRGVKRPRGSAR
jgi:hypothetical protein